MSAICQFHWLRGTSVTVIEIQRRLCPAVYPSWRWMSHAAGDSPCYSHKVCNKSMKHIHIKDGLSTRLAIVPTNRRLYCTKSTDNKNQAFSKGSLNEKDNDICNRQVIDETIEFVVQDILNVVNTRYGEVFKLPKQEMSKRMRMLVQNGLSREDLHHLIDNPNALTKYQQLLDLLKTLKELGVSEKALSKMINIDPMVLALTKQDILDVFQNLVAYGFPSDLIVKMIIEQPGLIKADLRNTEKRIEELKLIFNTKHTFQLLSSFPNLLFCDLDEITEKFRYVHQKMGISQPQMMHTKLFDHSIEHIHTRHMFVFRAGFFKKVKEKEIFNNPKLDAIIDTSDEDFAKKFGNMTLKDYTSFKELLLREKLLEEAETDGEMDDNDRKVQEEDDDEYDTDM